MPSKRNGKTMINLWVDDEELEKWKQSIKGSLSEFIRQAVEEKITQEIEATQKEQKRQELKMQYENIEELINAKFEEMKTSIAQAPVSNTSIPLKSQILNFLNSLGRPAQWEEILGVTGGNKDDIFDALADLEKKHILFFNKQGNYELEASE